MRVAGSVVLCFVSLSACIIRQTYRPDDCIEYAQTEWVVRASNLGAQGSAAMEWAEPNGAVLQRPVRLTRWRVDEVLRARPFPQTELPPLPPYFDAVDLSPDAPLASQHILFVRRIEADPFDAGFVLWSNFSYFQVDGGGWTRTDIRVPAITEAEVVARIESLDSQPYCARDGWECTGKQRVCGTSTDGGNTTCGDATTVWRCLVDGGILDAG